MRRAHDTEYDVVIGLEVHTHLRTDSKLFSPAPVRYGDDPNHNVHPIDLGLPGVLPVLNRAVVDLAIRLALAIHGTVNHRSVFSRKNYFYPDLPKGYQISQYEEPVVSGGWLEIEVPNSAGEKGEAEIRRIGITRAHLEEDAGKSIHDDSHAGADDTLVDLNRAGVPLLEIVSEPDLTSAEEAGAYLRKLRSILRYTDVSNADMEKGQFRCDANVSIKPRGRKELGTRTELKNINSFAFVEEAIRAEVDRQIEVLEEGGEIVQATMAYDPATGQTRVLRLKENADDYRYFDDPDLVPLFIDDEQIEAVRAAMPELPDDRRNRLMSEFGLSRNVAVLLTASRELVEFFEACVKLHPSPKSLANWMLRDLLQYLRECGKELDDLALTAETFAALIELVDSGQLTAKNARDLFPELATEGGDPRSIVQERGLEAVQDTGLLERAAKEVIDANPRSVEKFREGDAKVINFLMGQIMKATRGKANPAEVKKILERELSE